MKYIEINKIKEKKTKKEVETLKKLQEMKKKEIIEILRKYKNKLADNRNLLKSILFLEEIEKENSSNSIKKNIAIFEQKKKYIQYFKNDYKMTTSRKNKLELILNIFQTYFKLQETHETLIKIDSRNIHAWYLKIAHENITSRNIYFLDFNFEYITK